MKQGSSDRNRRAIVRGGALIVTMILLARGLPGLRRFEETFSQRILAAQQRLDAVTREERALRAVVDAALDGNPTGGARILNAAFTGATPTEAVAAAMQRVVGIASTLGATVHSVSPKTDSAFDNGIASLSVSVSFTTDAIGLRQILREWERGPRLLVPRSLLVQAPSPTAPNSAPEALRAEVVLAGVGRESGARRRE